MYSSLNFGNISKYPQHRFTCYVLLLLLLLLLLLFINSEKLTRREQNENNLIPQSLIEIRNKNECRI